MPLAGIKGSDRLLSKVELFPRRNSAVLLVPDCLSKVELFLRRNSTVVSFSSFYFLLLLPLLLLLFSSAGEGVTRV